MINQHARSLLERRPLVHRYNISRATFRVICVHVMYIDAHTWNSHQEQLTHACIFILSGYAAASPFASTSLTSDYSLSSYSLRPLPLFFPLAASLYVAPVPRYGTANPWCVVRSRRRRRRRRRLVSHGPALFHTLQIFSSAYAHMVLSVHSRLPSLFLSLLSFSFFLWFKRCGDISLLEPAAPASHTRFPHVCMFVRGCTHTWQSFSMNRYTHGRSEPFVRQRRRRRWRRVTQAM